MRTEVEIPSDLVVRAAVNYPVLAKCIDSKTPDAQGIIVCFISEYLGFVIKPTAKYHLGANPTWISVTNSQTWEILPEGSSVSFVQEKVLV